ncbi:MAG TPA: hypothetical protein HPP94_15080 [Desulfuromonadales bacterium]|nr:hypothetical protein [Desulfuromonadales bacterium]
MKPVAEMTLGELAAYVVGQLCQHGIEVVLTGGSCVSLYSDNRYQSFDLDLVERYRVERRKLTTTLAKIGFHPHERYFVHPDTPYFVEFPASPLAIGGEPMRDVAELVFPTGTLRLLTATDCVKDRLAHYYHWGDRQGLEQALLVAAHAEVDLNEIARWSAAEGMATEFGQISDELERAMNKLQ